MFPYLSQYLVYIMEGLIFGKEKLLKEGTKRVNGYSKELFIMY